MCQNTQHRDISLSSVHFHSKLQNHTFAEEGTKTYEKRMVFFLSA